MYNVHKMLKSTQNAKKSVQVKPRPQSHLHSWKLAPKMSKRKAPQGEFPNKDIADILIGE